MGKLLVLSGGRLFNLDLDSRSDDYKRSAMGFNAKDHYRSAGDYSGPSMGFGQPLSSKRSANGGLIGFKAAA